MEYFLLPDLKSLATLRAVIERGGVEPAAQSMHIGQPAVTKRLRALDACYGTTLMQRRGRRLEPTPAGERVYAYAVLVLDRQAILLDDLRSLLAGETRLRLEANYAIGEHLLPDLLLRFNARHPEYRVESRMGYSRSIQTRLATGLTDLALLEFPPEHPDILVQKWLDDELMLVCGRKHPLWDAGPLQTEALSGLRYVLREPQSSMRIHLDKVLREYGIERLPIALEVGSTNAVVEILERGNYVSFLPRFAVAEALAEGRLHHIRVEGLTIQRTLWIARTRPNLNNPVAEAFVQLLRELPTAGG